MKRNSTISNTMSKRQKICHNEFEDLFLSRITCHILPASFGLKRMDIFKKQIEKYGGKLMPDVNSSVTHIIVEDSIGKPNLEKLIDIHAIGSSIVVKCSWLSECLKSKSLIDEADHIVYKPLENQYDNSSSGNAVFSHVAANKCASPDHGPDIELLPKASKEESSALANEPRQDDAKVPIAKFQAKFACAHSSSSRHDHQSSSPNHQVTEELTKLLEVYRANNDTWRIAGYQKAIAAINAYPKEITSYDEARQIRGVGERLAAKVAEILASGKLRKVEEVCGSEETAVISLFLGVWGAGPSTARAWYAQGLRTLQDLHERASLTRHQKVGLLHYHDLNARIPRHEAAAIHSFVSRCCAEVCAGLVTEVCGSYRRGRATCGDVDILVSHPDGSSHHDVFLPLLDNMKKKGFLTDDLVTQEDNGNQQKYLGVCRLPGPDSKHRRIDIIVVPYSEFAPALLYFTGSAHFNRSMRLLATKMGMSLSEHGLRTNVVRKGREKLNDGCLLPTQTEESIFEHLGLPYRAPHERDH
ncbi:DNA polymerase lambda [Hyalella azteca]|uniref:DNA polymerase n=1 Tax=Hyalella azteca TaxID=294128 RepID=A0A979FPH1_HYAAZ|nr:DNA polymerase lambda [Hyalella azteca]